MKVLVLNCGSSSLKYQLFDMINESVLTSGLVEKIGLNGSSITNKRNDGDKYTIEEDITNHQKGIQAVLKMITSPEHGSLKQIEEIKAVGHRVAHGGEKFKSSVLVTNDVIAEIEKCVELAPLHNPANLEGIYSMQALLPEVPQCVVFDTSFHQTMPRYSYMYALPYALYEKYGIRRYGFHGTSHRFIVQQVAEMMAKPVEDINVISCHLGNGASISAIQKGKSIDTSMGFTPVEGLMMGTRVGDVDAGVLTFIMNNENLDANGLNNLLNKDSGVWGISGVSSDMREVEGAKAEGNKNAELALDMYHYRVKKYIGSYAAAMGGVDAIVFTGGIGENAVESREEVMNGLEYMGIDFDTDRNKVRGKSAVISKDNSKVKVMVIPTNEELMIARDTMELLKN